MAAPERQISLGGKDYRLRFSMTAFDELETHFSADSIVQVMEKIGDVGKLKSRDIIAIFRAMMLSNHPEITVPEVKKILDGLSLKEISSEIEKTVLAGSPAKEEGEARPQPEGVPLQE